MVVFAPEDPFQNFVDTCFVRSGQLSEGDCPGLQWGRRQGAIGFAQGLRRMATDPAFEAGWGYFLLSACRDVLSEEDQSFLVRLVARRDPIWIAILLRRESRTLPPRLYGELSREVTSPRLPTAHRELTGDAMRDERR